MAKTLGRGIFALVASGACAVALGVILARISTVGSPASATGSGSAAASGSVASA
jgi:hypothetical protein